ncbi:MAG TPA: bifunctional riboflavin kinase/FAD synthetase [Acidimicrobiales bacterium]|nr:bifunctional riboflavin kinase/FAD synthetase [Acidimicrobiales bacterium]
MEVYAAGAVPRDELRSAVTVGVYDGVHLGHRHVLGRLLATASDQGLAAAVVTFDPHPASVVAPEHAPRLLTTLGRRLELLEENGIDRVVVVAFDEARATQEPSSFVEEVLVGELRAATIVVGENFRFGRARRGDVELLESMASPGGYAVEPVALDASGGAPISSSRIREAIARGDVGDASAMLGRPHGLEGTVVRGDGRGRGLGFPTANLAVRDGLVVPAVGIYAGTWARPSGERHAAAISVGRRPTFYDDADVLVEAHLLDFDDDLYGEAGRLSFVARLRGEERFESVEGLVTQIGHDVAATRAALDRSGEAS